MRARGLHIAGVASLCFSLLLLACDVNQPKSGEVLDEASRSGRTAESFPAADENYFHDVDGAVALTPEEIKGRNMWLVWTGGNDRFWDVMTNATVGAFDLLKTISSYPGDPKDPEHHLALKFSRDNRWRYLGVINEPCFEKATGPDPERYGLWLDKRGAACPEDPFANEKKYPGVAIGSRGKTMPIGSYYGYPTGIVGLRLFPNPAFDEAAARKWDPKRYYDDPSYYLSKDLIRPYRVGMSCAFCHIGPSPIKPPADAENPKWENLNSTVGAQYFWFDRVFVWNADPKSFIFQLLHTMRPGALDTSLVSTDNINNPRTMNAIYSLGPRLAIAKRWGMETLAGGGLHNRQFNDFVKTGPLTSFFEAPDTVWTPHVLKDGSDSVGVLGALNRVFLNIGLFSEEWLLHFNAFVGGKPITPIEIAVAEKNSAYWRATEAQSIYLAQFLVRAGVPDRLRDAPGGAAYLTQDKAALEHGKIVFAERCARCHSSKIPAAAPGLDPKGCAGPGYLDCWNRYWSWTKTEEFKQQMRQIVLADDFLDGNYLSTEARVPVTLLQTNACSPLATNAIGGNIWDNFSSRSYKDLPSVGTISVFNPFTAKPQSYVMPAGGRGYTRPPSLISLWSTAPFLLNNTLGPSRFDPDPSVQTRMKVFQVSIEQLLWPETRDKDAIFAQQGPGVGVIDRTTTRSYLSVPAGYLPSELHPFRRWLNRLFPAIFSAGGDVEIGPIPEGTPVNLLANLNLLAESQDSAERAAHYAKVADLLAQIIADLRALPKDPSDEDARKVFAKAADRMLELSKCPDFVVNKGHYFGTNFFAEEPALSNQDKRDLIEFLKTF